MAYLALVDVAAPDVEADRALQSLAEGVHPGGVQVSKLVGVLGHLLTRVRHTLPRQLRLATRTSGDICNVHSRVARG